MLILDYGVIFFEKKIINFRFMMSFSESDNIYKNFKYYNGHFIIYTN